MTSESDGAAAPADPPAAEAAEDCATCITARGILFALAFAAFAAYVAADFATAGRVSAAVVGTLATLRGRADGGGQ